MQNYSGRNSLSHPTPSFPPPNLPPGLPQCERSVTNRQPWTPLDERSYEAESARLYPPIGYSGRGRNRTWAPKIRHGQKAFKAFYKLYKRLDAIYTATGKKLRELEVKNGVTEKHEPPGLLNEVHQDRTSIYLPVHHAQLYKIALEREEAAYHLATGRMEHFEKYPRIYRSSRDEGGHSAAVDYDWDQHAAALRDCRKHAKLFQLFST